MGRRDGQRDVIVVERGGSSFWWLVVGGAVGAGLALLFAPQTGAKTRKQLGRTIGKLRVSAEDALDELKDAIDPVTAEAEAADADEVGGSPARRELEKRLAAVRARRQRALAEEDEEPVA